MFFKIAFSYVFGECPRAKPGPCPHLTGWNPNVPSTVYCLSSWEGVVCSHEEGVPCKCYEVLCYTIQYTSQANTHWGPWSYLGFSPTASSFCCAGAASQRRGGKSQWAENITVENLEWFFLTLGLLWKIAHCLLNSKSLDSILSVKHLAFPANWIVFLSVLWVGSLVCEVTAYEKEVLKEGIKVSHTAEGWGPNPVWWVPSLADIRVHSSGRHLQACGGGKRFELGLSELWDSYCTFFKLLGMIFAYDSTIRSTHTQRVFGEAAFVEHAVLVHLTLLQHYNKDKEACKEWSFIWLTDEGWSPCSCH